MEDPTSLYSCYDQFFDTQIKGRYITLDHLKKSFESLKSHVDFSIIGYSENGLEIPMIRIGIGEKKVLAWSQMHGNESTTTKAVLDFLSFFQQKEFFQEAQHRFLTTYSLYIIPILNPDGAILYTRENSNGIDLNRDAVAKSQSETRALFDVFYNIKPELCLNLHDQRTIYGAAAHLPATVSFLAPAANEDRTITSTRRSAIKHIERMVDCLQQYIPGQIGRYDDAFNANCMGDAFQMKQVPTILFEAGHFQNDYQREQTRKYILLALAALFELPVIKSENGFETAYADIPENNKKFRDVILRNVHCSDTDEKIAIALQYKEILKNSRIDFQPVISEIGELDTLKGHLEIDIQGDSILVNSQEKFENEQNVSTICSKTEPSVVYFSMK